MSNGGDTDSGSGWKKLGPEGRRVAVWATGVVVILLIGTQLMIAFDRDVAWYSGFGQWLGALGSLFAAGVALWIATSDRRRVDDQRSADKEAQDEDLAREAGLVRIALQPYERPVQTWPAVSVRNYRKSRLFELELVEIEAEVAGTPEVAVYRWFTNGQDMMLKPKNLNTEIIESGDVLWLLLTDQAAPTSAVFRYTDETGRRWEVDTKGAIARKLL